MALQPPPPPSITPSQMTVLRIAATMAWSDGNLAEEEVEIMLDNFSGLFASASDTQETLRKELRDYMMQNIPLEESVPRLQSPEEKELVLRLGYAVISSSARTPEEDLINQEEAAAYQKLVELLNLPAEQVQQIETDVQKTISANSDLVDVMTEKLRKFIQPA